MIIISKRKTSHIDNFEKVNPLKIRINEIK